MLSRAYRSWGRKSDACIMYQVNTKAIDDPMPAGLIAAEH
jgi:hypothetical protein